MRSTVGVLLALALGVVALAANDAAPSLSLAERAAGMAAVERVRAAHRGSDPAAFDARYPSELWLEKAAEVARSTRCLADRYGVRVDDEALGRELRRMSGSSRAPERLEELFAALDHDPVRIKECLVRPVLAERLLARRLAWDSEIQAGARAEAAALSARLTPASFEVEAGERLVRFSYRPEAEGAPDAPLPRDESPISSARVGSAPAAATGRAPGHGCRSSATVSRRAVKAHPASGQARRSSSGGDTSTPLAP